MKLKKWICLLLALVLTLGLGASTVAGTAAEARAGARAAGAAPAEQRAEARNAAPAETPAPEESAAPAEDSSAEEASAGLPGWTTDSAVMKELTDYIAASADEDSDSFVPEEDRIAVFDLDGTLYGERFPVAFQLLLCIQRGLYDESYTPSPELRAFAQQLEDLATDGKPVENLDAKGAYYGPRFFQGMTQEEFKEFARSVKTLPVPGYDNMTYAEGFFQPMVSLVADLAEHGYSIYVCSGTFRDAVRVLLEGTLDEYIPADHVIGTDFVFIGADQAGMSGAGYNLGDDEQLVIAGETVNGNLRSNKVAAIQKEIGRRPLLAFGNSSGDFSMASYAVQNEDYDGRAYMVLCDDTVRDNGDTKAAEALRETCEVQGFAAISTKDDFAQVYGEMPERVAPVETEKSYTLDQVVVLSRHNIRAPLASNGAIPSLLSSHEWTNWTAKASELTLKGGVLETQMGQYFRKWLEDEGLFPENYIPEENEVRFYANAKQRTQATARYFAAGLLPAADVTVERHAELGKMDDVFNPILRYYSDAYAEAAAAQIADMGGDKGIAGADEALRDDIRLVMDIAGTEDTDAYKSGDYGDLLADTSEIILKDGEEPNMSGPIKTGCQLADTLVLQYYETADAREAAFGRRTTDAEWARVSNVKDTYISLTAGAPLVAVNTANGVLKELKSELTAKDRVFGFLCGHDVNLRAVLSALGVEEYVLPDSLEQSVPIGGKIVLERWVDEEGEAYYKASLVYQSLEQILNMTQLTLDTPPVKVELAFDGLEANADGLFTEKDFLGRLDHAISAFDRLAEDYPKDAKAGTDARDKDDAKDEDKTESKDEADTKADTAAKSDADTEDKTDTKADTDTKAGTGTKTETDTKADTNAKTGTNTKDRTDTRDEAEEKAAA